MNTRMYENPVTQDNLDILRGYGWQVVEPASGYLACGDTGAGKLPEPEELLDWILQTSSKEKDMQGLRVLVTAGPYPGSPGSGAVSDQPFFRENGLCHCEGCLSPGRTGDTGHRTHRTAQTPVYGSG